MKLRKGMRVRCKIGGKDVTDAKIQEENGEFYICNNVISGDPCVKKMGYRFSWNIGDGSESFLKAADVSDFVKVS